jgi:hypothetical protein
MAESLHETTAGPLTLSGGRLYEVEIHFGLKIETVIVVAADHERSAQARAMAVTSLDPRGRFVSFVVRELEPVGGADPWRDGGGR